MATEARGPATTGPYKKSARRRKRDSAAVGRMAMRMLANARRALRDSVIALVAARMPRDWVLVRLDHGVVENDPVPGWIPRSTPAPAQLRDVVECFELICRDPAVSGVLVRVGREGLGWSKLSAIARGILACRASGKHTVVYAESAGNGGAWLGATAEQFWLAPEGRVDLVGFQLESPFVRALLDRLKIRPMVVQGGRYKSAAELLERTDMSPESREALEAVADALFDALVDGLSQRAGSAERAREWIDDGPHQARDAVACGLVDRLLYPDQLGEALFAWNGAPDEAAPTTAAAGSGEGAPAGEAAPPAEGTPESATAGSGEGAPPHEETGDDGEPESVRPVAHDRYIRLARPRFRFRPIAPRPGGPDRVVAVVPIVGTITRASVRQAVRMLHALRKEPELGAVVVRIDSPGGDAEASDSVWHAIKRLRDEVPVVASMGDTAASGGYYAAMAANEIVGEDTTLTGSIGVVLAGIEIDELMETAGVRFDGVRRGAHAGIYSATHARTDTEREALRRQVAETYRSFVGKAAQDRGLSLDKMQELAEGRVWSGRDALAVGLIDHLGGLDRALERARALGGLDPEGPEPVYLASQPTPWRRLLAPWLVGFAAAPSLVAPIDWGDLAPGAKLLCPIRPPQI